MEAEKRFKKRDRCPWDPSLFFWSYSTWNGKPVWLTWEKFERWRIQENLRAVERRKERKAAGTYRRPKLTERDLEVRRRWKRLNPDAVRRNNRSWAERNREKRVESVKRWQSKNKDRVRAGARRRYNESTNRKLSTLCRNRINAALKGVNKSAKTANMIGCSLEQLRTHLESLFKPGMSWENYSFTGWHVDHIRPCASFDLSDPEQQKQCFHYTNLQPLWARENLTKHTKWSRSWPSPALPGSEKIQQPPLCETSDTTTCLSAPSSNAD